MILNRIRPHLDDKLKLGPLNITDPDFADDIALFSDTAAQAQEILNRVETAALHVGLHTNAKKTKFMSFNQQTVTKIQTQEPSLLEEVQDFKYLGAWVKSTEQDVKSRKPMAWKVCHNLSKIWKSNLSKNIKIKLFQVTVESVLLYGSQTWTVPKKIGKALGVASI